MLKVKDVLAEADALTRKIESGKLSGKSLKQARYRRHYLRQKAKKMPGATKPKLKSAKGFNANQGFLPGFLSMVNIARIEELVADRVFKTVTDAFSKDAAENEEIARDINAKIAKRWAKAK